MKNFIFIFCLFLLEGVQAQNLPYNFSLAQGTYVPLTNAISINNGQAWDDYDFELPLGFNFEFYGQMTSTLKFYGYSALNAFGLNTDPSPLLISYGADLYDRNFDMGPSVSPISYKVEGATGNRICKIEWANAGFFDDDTFSDYTNTQVWFFEGSNIIELHFGPTHVGNGDVFAELSGPVFGFMDSYSSSDDAFEKLWYLVGSTDDPELKKISNNDVDTLYQTVDGAPGNGLIYRFDPNVVGINEAQSKSSQVRVFPSIINDIVRLEISDELVENERDIQYEIVDQLGKKVQGALITNALTEIHIPDVPAGLYCVNFRSSTGVIASKKIVKQ